MKPIATLLMLCVFIALTSGAQAQTREAHDEFGAAVVDGDFDNDGDSELAVGIPNQSVGGASGAGQVAIFYGVNEQHGFNSSIQYFNQNSAGIADSAAYQEAFGKALAVGDFDDDGYSDLAIGVPGEMVSSHQNAGAVHILYGGFEGLTSSSSQLFDQSTFSTVAAGNRFGAELAAGDFNSDGYEDLAIGVPGQAVGFKGNAGAVNILWGHSTGLNTAAAQVLTENSFSPGAADSDEAFGAALAVGNFGRSNFKDLAIGIPSDHVDGNWGTGAVRVVYGSSTGLVPANNQYFTQDNSGGQSTLYDAFGFALKTGNFNGDGYTDLAVGAPLKDYNDPDDGGTFYDSGAVTVIYSSPDGWGLGQSFQTWKQGVGGLPDGPETNDHFGFALGAGDFNDDGFKDLAVGVPGEGNAGEGACGGGKVHVIFGSASGLTGSGDKLIGQSSANVYGAHECGDYFGEVLSSGDFDKDGITDLVVAAPFETYSGVNSCGYVNILNHGLGSNMVEWGIREDGENGP